MARSFYFATCMIFLLFWSVSLAQDLVHHFVSPPINLRYMKTFDVNFERSVYTWLSASALLTAGLLLFVLADRLEKGQPQRKYFIALGLIFFFLSADETLSIHERFGKLVPDSARSGAFYFDWVIPALVLVAIVAVAFLRFLLTLPRKEMLLMVASGVIFVGGAVGMEMIAGVVVERFGEESLAFRLEASLEEGLEAAGVLLFIYCLLNLLENSAVARISELTSTSLRTTEVSAASPAE